MKTKLILISTVIIITFTWNLTYAHCEIPCGIYDDLMRVELISEHITTIEKSMNQITVLSTEQPPNWNQLVRWVNNKEHHADELIHIVSQYFMTQRIKPTEPSDKILYEKYILELSLLHKMIVTAMKCKQTTDTSNTTVLRDLVKKFNKSYFGSEEPKHDHH